MNIKEELAWRIIVRKLAWRKGPIATGLRELWGYIYKESKGECSCADAAQ